MPKKSIFAQLKASAVPPHKLLESPRYQNPGLFKYAGKYWLAYRYHRMDTPTKRSGIGICEIDVETGEPKSASQRIPLSNPTNSEHHEDCRLFIFNGDPFISYTTMQGYVPGVNYTCVMQHAKLKFAKNKWSVVQEWQPRHGNNTGFAKEKNWVFFEHNKALYCIYATDPEHVVLRIEGDEVVETIKTPGPLWQWVMCAEARRLSILVMAGCCACSIPRSQPRSRRISCATTPPRTRLNRSRRSGFSKYPSSR